MTWLWFFIILHIQCLKLFQTSTKENKKVKKPKSEPSEEKTTKEQSSVSKPASNESESVKKKKNDKPEKVKKKDKDKEKVSLNLK